MSLIYHLTPQENLLNFDKENISQKAIQTIRSKYRDNQEFKSLNFKKMKSHLNSPVVLWERLIRWGDDRWMSSHEY